MSGSWVWENGERKWVGDQHFVGSSQAAVAVAHANAGRERQGGGGESLIARAERWVLSEGIVDPDFPDEPCPFAVNAAMQLHRKGGAPAVGRSVVVEIAQRLRARAGAAPLKLNPQEEK